MKIAVFYQQNFRVYLAIIIASTWVFCDPLFGSRERRRKRGPTRNSRPNAREGACLARGGGGRRWKQRLRDVPGSKDRAVHPGEAPFPEGGRSGRSLEGPRAGSAWAERLSSSEDAGSGGDGGGTGTGRSGYADRWDGNIAVALGQS